MSAVAIFPWFAGVRPFTPAGANERTMPAVEIEYCVPCGMLPRAQDLQEAILEEYGESVDRVALVTGDAGVFEVRVDDERVFDKEEDEYDEAGIVDDVGEFVGAAA